MIQQIGIARNTTSAWKKDDKRRLGADRAVEQNNVGCQKARDARVSLRWRNLILHQVARGPRSVLSMRRIAASQKTCSSQHAKHAIIVATHIGYSGKRTIALDIREGCRELAVAAANGFRFIKPSR